MHNTYDLTINYAFEIKAKEISEIVGVSNT